MRQQISVFNHLGQTVSYVTLAGCGGKGEVPEDKATSAVGETGAPGGTRRADVLAGPKEPAVKKRQPGTLERLSLSMRNVARAVAASEPVMLVYDNINMMWRAAEQVMGRTGVFLCLPPSVAILH